MSFFYGLGFGVMCVGFALSVGMMICSVYDYLKLKIELKKAIKAEKLKNKANK